LNKSQIGASDNSQLSLPFVELLRRSKATERLLPRVKSFFPTVPFLHYRLWEGTADAPAHGS
jgi:hypothetical protein